MDLRTRKRFYRLGLPVGGFELRVDEKQLLRVEKMLAAYPKRAPRILSRAVNKIAVWVRQRSVEGIRAERPGLKIATVRAALKLSRASYRRPVATIRLGDKRIRLIEMSPNPKTPEADLGRNRRTGVSYRKASGGRARIANAFVARMHTGHVGVYVRHAPERWKIGELRGPSVLQVLIEARALLAQTMSRGAQRLAMEVERQVMVELERGAR